MLVFSFKETLSYSIQLYGDAKGKASIFLYEVLDRDVDDDFKQRAELMIY